jgi:hypothetical protein
MPTLKNILIFIAIAAASFSAYFFFLKPSSSTPELVSSPVTTSNPLINTTGIVTSAEQGNGDNGVVAGEFLSLLLSVKSIKLNNTIFSENAYKSLRDSSITLTPDGNEGRPNPFAPIGNDVPNQEIEVKENTTTETVPEVPTDSNVIGPTKPGKTPSGI